LNERIDPRVEIGVALMLILIASLALFGTADIPPGRFEPLGSAPVPQAVAGLILILSLWIIVRTLIDRRPIAANPASRYLDALVVAVLTLVFVAAMQQRLAAFSVLTTLYLVATIGFLVRFDRKRLPWVVVVAAVTGFGFQYLFTRVFVVDLPGL
jgi:putative tricarboxylic transport membrane protein